jgi:hypothetical protein
MPKYVIELVRDVYGSAGVTQVLAPTIEVAQPRITWRAMTSLRLDPFQKGLKSTGHMTSFVPLVYGDT